MAQKILGSTSEDEENFNTSFEMDDDWSMALQNGSNQDLLLTGVGFLCCRPPQDPLATDEMLACDICKVKFTSQLSLENHKKNYLRLKVEQDDVPSERLAQVYKRNNTFYCIHCKFKTIHLTHVRAHMLKHKMDDPHKFEASNQSLKEDAVFTCTICKVMFTSQLNLENHRKSCEKNQDVNIEVIDNPAIVPSDILEITRDEHKDDLHEIEASVNVLAKDKPRTLEVPNGKQFKCTFSGCLYSSDKKFETHRHIARHGGKIIMLRIGPVYKCNHCNHTSVNGSNMRKHKATHNKERSYQCAHCPYRAKDRHGLTLHLRSHSLIKQYKCSQCEFSTSYKSSLKNHMAMHTGNFKYKCSKCDFKTTRFATLTTHMLIHTGEKPFQCPHCPYKASQSYYLSHHLRVHTGEKPFACANCEYKTARRSSLKKHVQMTHK